MFSIWLLIQLPQSSLDTTAFWKWAESVVLEEAKRLETLCRSVEDSLNAPFIQVGVKVLLCDAALRQQAEECVQTRGIKTTTGKSQHECLMKQVLI